MKVNLSLFTIISLFISCLFSQSLFAQVNFTGNAENDFLQSQCIRDGDTGPDVGIPELYDLDRSGFDFDYICLDYDQTLDVLSVGLIMHRDSQGQSVIFGDADHDDDPAISSNTFVDDVADLGLGEWFYLIVKGVSSTGDPIAFVAGVPYELSLNNFMVNELADSQYNIALARFAQYYGDQIEISKDSKVNLSPNIDHPSLEFNIVNFSKIMDFEDLDSEISFYFGSGSFIDNGVGDDLFEKTVKVSEITEIVNNEEPVVTPTATPISETVQEATPSAAAATSATGAGLFIEGASCSLNKNILTKNYSSLPYVFLFSLILLFREFKKYFHLS